MNRFEQRGESPNGDAERVRKMKEVWSTRETVEELNWKKRIAKLDGGGFGQLIKRSQLQKSQ